MARLPLLLAILALSFNAAAAPISMTFATQGLTYHPGGVNPKLAEYMPNRITDNGDWVYHTVEYTLHISYEGYQASAQYLRDCFDNDAQAYALGRDWSLWITKIGLAAGVYVRKKVWFDSPDETTTWVDMPGTVYRGSTQYVPLFLATLYVPIWRFSDHAALSLLVAANTWVTHFTSGVTMEW